MKIQLDGLLLVSLTAYLDGLNDELNSKLKIGILLG